jgi:ATP-dependent helicase HrpA
VHIPVDVLAQVGSADFDWPVPALREPLVTALIRGLPKPLRRNFVPAPDTARAVLANLTPGAEPLIDGLQRELHRLSGVLVPREEFSFDRVPAHLRPTFAIEDGTRTVLARGKDLDQLRAKLTEPARAAIAAAIGGGIERDGLRAWPADLVLARVIERTVAGNTVLGYPALVAAADGSVGVRVLSTEAQQQVAMQAGTRQLLRLAVSSPARELVRSLSTARRLTLTANPDGGLGGLVEDCIDAATDDLVAQAGGPAWDATGFATLSGAVSAGLPRRAAQVLELAERVMAAALATRSALPTPPSAALAPAVADVVGVLDGLLGAGFVTRTGAARLPDLIRYVTAEQRRLERLPREVDVDAARMARVQAVVEAYTKLVAALPAARAGATDVTDIGWQIQELRVSLFAQQLGTPRPVSEQRIYRAIDAVTP